MRAFVFNLYGIPLLGTLMLAVMFSVLVAKKRLAEFPVFSTYIGFMCLDSIVMKAIRVYSPFNAYWYAYWIQTLIETLLSIGVILELFKRVLGGYAGIRRMLKRVVLAVTMVLLVASIVMVIIAPASDRPIARLTTVMIEIDRSGEFFRLGLVALFLIVVQLLGLPVRRPVLGIAIGIGLSSALTALTESLRVQWGFGASAFYKYMTPLAFDFGVLIWGYYFLTKEKVMESKHAPLAGNLERWNAALEGLLAK